MKKYTMAEYLKKVIYPFGDKPAVRFFEEKPYSYKEVFQAAYLIAKKLAEIGFKKGDKAVLYSENSPFWSMVYLGVSGAGYTIVPVLTDFPVDDVRNIITHSDAKAVFVSPRYFTKAVEAASSLKVRFFITEGLFEENDMSLNSESLKERLPDLHKILENVDLAEAMSFYESIDIQENDLCALIYTSGTTGKSKGVMLSHKNLISNVESGNTVPHKKKTKRTVSFLPLAHTYECSTGLFLIFLRGAEITYIRRQLSPTILMNVLEKTKPEMMLTVPLLIEKIYRKKIAPALEGKKSVRRLMKIPLFRKIISRAAGRKLLKSMGGKLYFFGIGGAPLAEDVERFLRDAKFPYAMGYGLTETSPLVVGTCFKDSKFRSTGHFIPGVTVKLDNVNPETGEGEILVKGPNVMLGYYKDEAKTKECMTEDGFFRTGDLGRIKGKHLYISGRIKNIIVGPSGENIYPEIIEEMINQFDFVEESMVFHDEKQGLIARIHLNPEEIKKQFKDFKDKTAQAPKDLTEYLKQLQKKVNEKLAGFSRVKVVLWQKDPFNKTPTNKIKRFMHDKFTKEDKVETDTSVNKKENDE